MGRLPPKVYLRRPRIWKLLRYFCLVIFPICGISLHAGVGFNSWLESACTRKRSMGRSPAPRSRRRPRSARVMFDAPCRFRTLVDNAEATARFLYILRQTWLTRQMSIRTWQDLTHYSLEFWTQFAALNRIAYFHLTPKNGSRRAITGQHRPELLPRIRWTSLDGYSLS
jgi:hypothetical protein